jgi:hypothetical protein
MTTHVQPELRMCTIKLFEFVIFVYKILLFILIYIYIIIIIIFNST